MGIMAQSNSLGATIEPCTLRGFFCHVHERLLNSIWALTEHGEVFVRSSRLLIERAFVALGVLAARGWVHQLQSHVKRIMKLGLEMRTLFDVFLEIEGITAIARRNEVGCIAAVTGSPNSKMP